MVTKAKLRLSFMSSVSDRVAPLIDGRVQPEGIELIHTMSGMSEGAWRVLNFKEFQVHELSISSYIIAKSMGMDFIAIPVFPHRTFMHTGVLYHEDSGIQKPSDLNGKKLGVGEYQQTAVLWMRGILMHDFDVDQFKVHWWMERTEEMSHGGATGFKPMEGISFNRIPADKSLSSMLVSHELDAARVTYPWVRSYQDGNNVDRSWKIKGEGDWSKVKPLFPDKRAEGIRFFKEHGFIPANHTYVIRGDVYREHPWVALNLYNALVQAKQVSIDTLEERMPTNLVFGNDYMKMTREALGTEDPYPYGFKANQKMLQTIVDYSHEQGFIKEKPKVEELFAPVTVSL
jgi:4,5-dihydroxyphthalate decarboxylase